MATSDQPSVEPAAPDPTASLDASPEKQTGDLQGVKLVGVIGSLGLVAFLLLLDVSIVSTVSRPILLCPSNSMNQCH